MPREKEKAAPEDETVIGAKKLAKLIDPTDIASGEDGPMPLRPITGDDYCLREELGRGGMGQVILSSDRRLGREVALKRLIDVGAAREARFIREMLITARLQHPSIVPIYDAGRWQDGALVYTMRKVGGRTLKRCVEGKPLDERLAHLSAVVAAAEAIAYAHEVGVIHRDIKPSNLVVGDFGETVVIDWGLAKALDDEDESGDGVEDDGDDDSFDPATLDLTAVGSAVGTPLFMSPEQARGEKLGKKTDVFSLGACLYQLLTGEAPSAERRPPESMERRVPMELVAIANAAMSAAPDDRPTAKAFAEELRRFQTGALLELYDYSRWQLLRRWIRKHRLASAIAVVSLVVLAALAARLVIEARNTETALRRVVAQSDQLALANARSTADEDPLRAIEVLGVLSGDPQVWPRARVIASRARRSGLPVVLAVIPDADDLALTDDGLVASGSGRAWLLPNGGGPVAERPLPPRARRIDDRHWIGVRDKAAVLFDAVTGDERTVQIFDEVPAQLSASSDGRLLAATREGRGYLWRNGEMILEVGDALEVAVSPDGAAIVVVVGDPAAPTIEELSTNSRAVVRSWKSRAPLTSVTHDSDGVLIAFDRVQVHWRRDGGSRRSVCDLPLVSSATDYACAASGRVIIGPLFTDLPAPGGAIDVALATNASIVVVGSQGAVTAWNYRGTPVMALVHPTRVTSVALDATGRRAATLAQGGFIREWDLSELSTVQLRPTKPLSPGPDDQMPFTQIPKSSRAGALIGADQPVGFIVEEGEPAALVRVRDSGSVRERLELPANFAAAELRASPDGKRVVVYSGSLLNLVDSAAFTTISEQSFTSPITDVEFVRDANQLLVGTAAGAVVRIDLETLRRVTESAGGAAVTAIAGRGEWTAIARAGDPSIRLRGAGGERLLSGHQVDVADLDFSPLTDELVSVANEVDIYAWTTAGQRRLLGRVVDPPQRIRYSASARSIVLVGETGGVLIDAASGEFRRVISLPASDWAAADDESIFWFSDGNYIMTVRDDLPGDERWLRQWMTSRLAEAAGPT